MTSTPKAGKYVSENEPSSGSPLAGPGPGGHKASFKSTKLARRARSFKDDFLGKISQMRSPAGPGGLRSHSPKLGPRTDAAEHPFVPAKGPIQELDDLWKQAQIALKHFRDVVSKKIFAMLPGNGTIILDTVWLINLAVKSSVLSENSSSVSSATNCMYQSVARLIKLCDDVLIDDESSELEEGNVNEIVERVEDAVKSLILLAQEKISKQQGGSYKTTARSSFANLESSTQRNSLPDIPLTPREREILEQTSCVTPAVVRGSHSTESILRETTPPPKPPLPSSLRRSDPNCVDSPPPLPPKKKTVRMHQLMDTCCSMENSPGGAGSLERVSVRSKSPEDSISLLSEGTGSIDSMLNHSLQEEDEIKALMECDGDMLLDNHSTDIFGANSWEESSLNSSISNNEHHTSLNDYHRLSNTDSGIASYWSSNYSKRSSQQSSVSSQFSSIHNTSKQISEMVKSESILQNLNRSLENHLTLHSYSQQKSSNSGSLLVLSNSSQSMLSKEDLEFLSKEVPPAIPQKTRKKTERQPSPYDNVPDEKLDDDIQGELLVTCERHQSHQSLASATSVISTSIQDSTKPPPLPPKQKKHIMAYMEMFGNCSHTNDQEFMRHSVHMVQSQWMQQPNSGLTTTQSCSFSHSSSHSSHSQIKTLSLPGHSSSLDQRIPSPLSSPNASITSTSSSTPPALPPKQRARKSSTKSPPPTPTTPSMSDLKPSPTPIKVLPDLLEHTSVNSVNDEKAKNEEVNPCDIDLMEELNIEKYLVLKKPDEDGPDIRGGPKDALIIQATKATKNGVFTYQEAFLTTYRTFITPHDLISKLIRRYNHFYYMPDKKPRSREAFALIVRVVSDLTSLDLDIPLQHQLMGFVQHLICCGELTLAKALRVKHLERHEAKQSLKLTNIVSSVTLNPKSFTLLDFKSEQIAEQMTLLDAELFMKIEIPEVFIWAQEQNEERSPNLKHFTEHFNKMSYWARTRILTAENRETREKYFMKFIKIMKHLRKINNYNSYLALLSALDSAPLRRLEWPKQVQEGLKEYCALIDSSSSFRAYRMALAATQPPCIPYIGLVLQDLTFVHIGNSDLLPDGTINFTKCWQYFNIVENMKKFKKSTYKFKKQEKIIQFFEDFEDSFAEEALWKLSETIKPRGTRKTNL